MENSLKGRLKGNIVIVGIGNPLRGDDGTGQKLVQILRSKYPTLPNITLIDAGEAPENYLFKIPILNPDTIMLVDAADFDAPAGTAKIIDPDDLPERGFSTHTASLKLIIDILKNQTDADVFLLGIQPKSIKLGDEISPPVSEAIEKIAEIIGGV